MPRPVKKSPGSSALDKRHVAALLVGCPLGIQYRRDSLFYCEPKTGFPAEQRALLRRLWQIHGECLTASFEARHGLKPWGYWAFESQEQFDWQPYDARWEALRKQWDAEFQERWQNGGREAALARIAAKTAARIARGETPPFVTKSTAATEQ